MKARNRDELDPALPHLRLRVSFRAPKNLQSHCRCTICHVDMVAALDDMIAITFPVSPSIRRIAGHDPDTLSGEDYVLRIWSSGSSI